jgi:hypothetical protein
MKVRKRATGLAVGLVAVVPFVVAPGASAGMSDVQDRLAKADAALERAAGLVAGNEDAAAAIALARANNQTRLANREAKGVKRQRGVSRANRNVALQFSENATVGLELIEGVGRLSQDDIAGHVENALQGRDRAVSVLTGLLDQVPEQAKPAIAAAIASIGLDGGEQADTIGELVSEEGALTVDAAAVLARVTERLDEALARIEGILAGVLDRLPPEAQGPVEAALGQISSILEGILGDLGSIFDQLPTGPPSGPPFGGGSFPPIGGPGA